MNRKGWKRRKDMIMAKQMMTNAKITSLDDWSEYFVTCVDDCRDKTDRSAYESAIACQDVVQMGKICVEPIMGK